MSAIEERRQRAREAFMDAIESGEQFTVAVDDAIETATRVKITDEAIREFGAAWRAVPGETSPMAQHRAALAAALAELGFEVES